MRHIPGIAIAALAFAWGPAQGAGMSKQDYQAAKKRIAADGGDPFASTPAEYEAYIARETLKWSALIRRLDLKVD